MSTHNKSKSKTPAKKTARESKVKKTKTETKKRKAETTKPKTETKKPKVETKKAKAEPKKAKAEPKKAKATSEMNKPKVKKAKGDVTKPVTTATSKSKKNVYPSLPKNKRTAYTLFFTKMHPEYAKSHKDAKFDEIVKAIAAKWKTVSEKEKAKYVKESEQDKERYNQEKRQWDEDVKQLGGDPEQVVNEMKMAKKRKRDKIKEPSKPRNLYVCFGDEKRKESTYKGMEFAQVSKMLSVEWTKVSEKDKLKYKKLAEQDVIRYNKEMEEFKKNYPEYIATTKKRKRKAKDEPKNPKNAYIIFSNEERQKLLDQFPELTTKTAMVELGKKWKALDEKTKAKYEVKASQDKIRYQQEKEVWDAKQAQKASV